MLKPPKSFVEQIYILIDRGLSIDNFQAAKGYSANKTVQTTLYYSATKKRLSTTEFSFLITILLDFYTFGI